MKAEYTMQQYNAATQPVLEAIDRAVETIWDVEAIEEAIKAHLKWWAEEIEAL